MWMMALGLFFATLLSAALAFTDVGRKYRSIAKVSFYVFLVLFLASLAMLVGLFEQA